MSSFLDDGLLSIYNLVYDTMYLINNLFFPDRWIKFIIIFSSILSLTYYFIKSYKLEMRKSYITKLFQTFMMVFTVYFAITLSSFWIKTLISRVIDRKEIALQLNNPLIKKEIIVNGKLENNSHKLIYSFMNIRDISRRSYHWGEKINIEILLGEKKLKFQLEEDNKVLNDYWVFFFKENKYNYIGHIKTDYFEK